MAKSNLDRLKDAISAAIELLSQMKAGDDPGQYPLAAVEAFQSAIKDAESLVATDGAEPSQFEVGNNVLNEARESFISSKVVEPPKEEIPDVVELTLIGTPSQCKGSHSIHFNEGIVTFQEGKTFVPSVLGDTLIKAGYAK
ncbi:hypothetical protein [Paenibacillus pabuli]|uniref:hypothetical protein n=1 Tax=Paenibacillus pabuli TaxID=1472 RepID=UPI003CF6897A